MSHTKCIPLFIDGAFVIEFPQYKDQRGYFEELYNSDKYPSEVPVTAIQQLSCSHSNTNVFRGLHCSPYYKLVSCVSGEVYDIIADVRKDSPTYLKWVRIRLSSSNHRQVFVPPGCGHAFYSTKDNSIMVYAQGGTFNPAGDRNMSWKDPVLNIEVPFMNQVVISEKDSNSPCLDIPLEVCMPGRKRILVIGSSGKLGSAICTYIRSHCDEMVVFGTYFENVVERGMMKHDLEISARDESYAEDLLDICCPHVVIICGSWTNVSQCDVETEKAAMVITKGPANIAKFANKRGIKVVALSTDYVFDGEKESGPYTEDDVPNPFSGYGKNKYEMEKIILNISSDALIVRTTTVNGKDLKQSGTFYTLYEYLASGKEFFVPEATRSPTYVKDLAKMIVKLVETDAKGIVHGCGDEAGSLLEYFQTVAIAMGFKSDFIKTRERRKYQPKYSSMSSEKRKKLLPEFQSMSTVQAVNDWMKMESEYCERIKKKYGH